MLLPAIKRPDSADDGFPIEAMQIMRFEGENWQFEGRGRAGPGPTRRRLAKQGGGQPPAVVVGLRSDVVLGALHAPDAPAPRRALGPVAASRGIQVPALSGLQVGEEPVLVPATGVLSIVYGRLQRLVGEHGGATFGSSCMMKRTVSARVASRNSLR
jgi:hypothetical protein